MEFEHEDWEWEEELTVFSLEEVGLGIFSYLYNLDNNHLFFSALIIVVVGLGMSAIVFVIEKVVYFSAAK